jgi:hypothetical protein
VQDEPAGPGGGLAGDVQDLGAEHVRFGDGEVAVEADELGPHDEGDGDEGGVQPGFVVRAIPVGLTNSAGGLPAADPVLDAGVVSVPELESAMSCWVLSVRNKL